MEWALGFAEGVEYRKLEMLGVEGQLSTSDISSLSKEGLPTSKERQKRLPYEGEFSEWTTVDGTAYLEVFGIRIPQGKVNHQTVFSLTTAKGETIQVPALVLMRAFFKPAQPVFSTMFTPVNVDLLSFVDYGRCPPSVVIDDAQCAKHCSNHLDGVNQGKFIQWLQASLSARRLAQSVHQHAQAGRLSMDIPIGRVRIIFHGRHVRNTLFATKASLISVDVPGGDSIAGADMSFTFHSSKDAERTPLAGIGSYQVPMHSDGQSAVTEDEWKIVEPLLIGKKGRATINPRRTVLDIILHKLSSGMSWQSVPKGTTAVLDVTMTFRRWAASGRLNNVLTYLYASRGRANCSGSSTPA